MTLLLLQMTVVILTALVCGSHRRPSRPGPRHRRDGRRNSSRPLRLRTRRPSCLRHAVSARFLRPLRGPQQPRPRFSSSSSSEASSTTSTSPASDVTATLASLDQHRPPVCSCHRRGSAPPHPLRSRRHQQSRLYPLPRHLPQHHGISRSRSHPGGANLANQPARSHRPDVRGRRRRMRLVAARRSARAYQAAIPPRCRSLIASSGSPSTSSS